MALKSIDVVIDEGGIEPVRAHEEDAGLDIKCPYDAYVPANGMVVIDTKLHVAIPKGYVGKIENRSSMFRRGILTNGTIDAGYTGIVGIILHNLKGESYHIAAGDKIAQLIVKKIETPAVNVVEALEESERGYGGFGSTGK